jgi:hypothetical protein
MIDDKICTKCKSELIKLHKSKIDIKKLSGLILTLIMIISVVTFNGCDS